AVAVIANGLGWLSVTPGGGTIAPSSSANVTVKIDVVTPALSAGTYTGSIGISGLCTKNNKAATGSPVLIPVNVLVKSVRSALVTTPSTVPIDVPLITNQWTASSTAGQPDPARTNFSAVWTGLEIIVFGGIQNNTSVNSGGRHDPITDLRYDVRRPG